MVAGVAVVAVVAVDIVDIVALAAEYLPRGGKRLRRRRGVN